MVGEMERVETYHKGVVVVRPGQWEGQGRRGGGGGGVEVRT